MIDIDPPYNTGNDFIYPDNYSESLQAYLEYSGQVDEPAKGSEQTSRRKPTRSAAGWDISTRSVCRSRSSSAPTKCKLANHFDLDLQPERPPRAIGGEHGQAAQSSQGQRGAVGERETERLCRPPQSGGLARLFIVKGHEL